MKAADHESQPTNGSADTDHQSAGESGQRTLRIEHREAGLVRAYTNAFRSFTSGEELVLDFGFNLVRIDPAAVEASGADGSVAIDWTHRSVMSYRTAKSLAIELARVVRDHERVHGEIVMPGTSIERSSEGEP